MVEIISLDGKDPETERLQKAVQPVREEKLVIYPTETVYGLGADATTENAVTKVFEAKSRPQDKPISIAVDSLSMCYRVGKLTHSEEFLIRKFLPGPLTVLVEPRPLISDAVSAGTGKVGIRIPDQPLARQFIKLLGGPITSTSANISGGRPPKTVEEAVNQLGDYVDFVIDVGRCEVGESSTVVEVSGGNVEIIREGPISKTEIEKALD